MSKLHGFELLDNALKKKLNQLWNMKSVVFSLVKAYDSILSSKHTNDQLC